MNTVSFILIFFATLYTIFVAFSWGKDQFRSVTINNDDLELKNKYFFCNLLKTRKKCEMGLMKYVGVWMRSLKHLMKVILVSNRKKVTNNRRVRGRL